MPPKISAMSHPILTFAAGAAVSLAAIYGLTAVSHLQQVPQHSVAASPLPLQPVANAPAVITLGTPNFRGTPYATSADGKTSSGIWAADGPSTFEWHFGSDETVYVLQGQVDVNYQGQQFSLRPGDTAVFLEGTRAVWHVPQNVLKSYTLHHPNALVRYWRKLAG